MIEINSIRQIMEAGTAKGEDVRKSILNDLLDILQNQGIDCCSLQEKIKGSVDCGGDITSPFEDLVYMAAVSTPNIFFEVLEDLKSVKSEDLETLRHDYAKMRATLSVLRECRKAKQNNKRLERRCTELERIDAECKAEWPEIDLIMDKTGADELDSDDPAKMALKRTLTTVTCLTRLIDHMNCRGREPKSTGS